MTHRATSTVAATDPSTRRAGTESELVGPTTTVGRTADENSKRHTRAGTESELVGPTTTVGRTADENSKRRTRARHLARFAGLAPLAALAERLDR